VNKYADFLEAEIILAITADDEDAAAEAARKMLPGERVRFRNALDLAWQVTKRVDREATVQHFSEQEEKP